MSARPPPPPPPPPSLPPRPPRKPVPALLSQEHYETPPPLPSRPKPSSSPFVIPVNQQYQSQPSIPSTGPAIMIDEKKGFSATPLRRNRWLPVTRSGRILLWTVIGIIAVIVLIIVIVVPVKVTQNQRSSTTSASDNGNTNNVITGTTSSVITGTTSSAGPSKTISPISDRIASDYIGNPIAASQGGVDFSSGPLPKFGKNSTDHFVIHSDRSTVITRLDPIVSPGETSQHVHRFHGSSYVTPNLVGAMEMQSKAKCSTNRVQDDKSLYWIPQLYYRNTNGTFQSIPVVGHATYYFMKAPINESIYPFPDNYNIVNGNPNKRVNTTDDNGSTSWNCYRNGNDTSGPGFPATQCTGGLIQIITFPSCWDGVTAEDGNYKPHVTFPTDGGNGWWCPSDFPYKLPTVQFETLFDVMAFPWNGANQTWALANGDVTGLGAHGDFVNGWLPKTQQAWIDVCRYMNTTFASTEPSDPGNCPALNRTYSAQASQDCRMQEPIIDEPVGQNFSIPLLPGCNALWVGNVSKPACPTGRVDGGTPNLVQPEWFYDNEPYVY